MKQPNEQPNDEFIQKQNIKKTANKNSIYIHYFAWKFR